MLTKKEKLLIYPWQLKRFHQHRKKVQSAGPAIDFYPPNDYPHITAKLKKMQKESERADKVHKDNIRLLQRLGSIMTTKRLKNYWDSPRPSFLNREVIPHLNLKSNTLSTTDEDEPEVDAPRAVSGKSKCAICSGKFRKTNKIIPESRIPWKPSTPTKNMKLLREADNKPHKCCKFCCWWSNRLDELSHLTVYVAHELLHSDFHFTDLKHKTFSIKQMNRMWRISFGAGSQGNKLIEA